MRSLPVFVYSIMKAFILYNKGTTMEKCKICDTLFTQKPTGPKRIYCSSACKGRAHQNNCYEKQQIRGANRKAHFLNLSEGKCVRCGYCKNTAALSFHHLDPAEKAFQLDMRNLSNRKMSDLTREFEKCILLCLNCHAEEHHPDHEVSTPGPI
jgi:hypothetical protein